MPKVGVRKIALIIPSRFTTQIEMLKSGESNNRAANPPGCVRSDIKRSSLSSLSDRIPHKKEPCYSYLSGRALLLWNGGWRQRSMISVVTFV